MLDPPEFHRDTGAQGPKPSSFLRTSYFTSTITKPLRPPSSPPTLKMNSPSKTFPQPQSPTPESPHNLPPHNPSPPPTTSPTTNATTPPSVTEPYAPVPHFLTADEAYSRITSWFDGGGLAPLDLQCSLPVFTSTLARLECAGKLPRLARDYNTATATWHLRSRPLQMHEIGNKVLHGIEKQLMPQLSTGPFAALAPRIEWFLGSPTTELAAGGTKEPDASMGIRGRKRPTIVIEVGYTESLQRLRMDARRWLTAEVEGGGRGKRKREVNGPVMLVVLISYEGLLPDATITNKLSKKTPAEDTGKTPRGQPANENPGPVDSNNKPHFKAGAAADAELGALKSSDTSITDNAEATTESPFSIFVELWRNLPVTSPSRTTRAASTVTHEPVQCERHRFYPSLDPADPVDRITLYATDLFAEWVHDPSRKRSWKLPLALLKDAYEAMWETWKGVGEVEEMQVVVVSDEDSGGEDAEGEADAVRKRVKVG